MAKMRKAGKVRNRPPGEDFIWTASDYKELRTVSLKELWGYYRRPITDKELPALLRRIKTGE